MKSIFKASAVLCALLFAATGCNDTVERTFYDGPDYVIFPDTLTTTYVTENDVVKVMVSSTRKASQDRTFGVEVVAKGSTAIEDYHFTLASSNVTIKAGELATTLDIAPKYENFNSTDSLGVVLQLVLPEKNQWSLYGVKTKVTFQKHCPFNREHWLENEKRAQDPQKYNYANYILYASFPYSNDASQLTKILVQVVADPRDEYGLIVKSPFMNNCDMKIRMIPDGPGEDYVQVLAQDLFITDNYGWITMETNDLYPTSFNSCTRYIDLVLVSYKAGQGAFGNYPYYLEWITERRAEEYHNNGEL